MLSYCISREQQAEQIRVNAARGLPKIRPRAIRPDPLALVCFGPSLRDTWQEILGDSMTCSGAYKFLRERNLTPTYHVEVDPRPHKIALIGNNISPTTTFLLPTCCHPDLFDHLLNLNATIMTWHAYDGGIDPPDGGWAIAGGCTAGLRALVLARFLGYRDLHIFGMDGSFSDSSHAAPHVEDPRNPQVWAEFRGKSYRTTRTLIESANDFFTVIATLPDVKTSFHGTGLIPDMAAAKLSTFPRDPNSTIAVYHPE